MSRTAHHALIGAIAFVVCMPCHAAGLRDEAADYRAQGFERQRQGDLAGALSLYQKSVALDPSYTTPYNDMGVLYEEMGSVAEARQAYEQALALDPLYLQAHANLAMLLERIGEKERAIYHWLKRYQGGDPYDPGTQRAEERLVALGVMELYPGLKGKLFTRRHVMEQELEANKQTLKEYEAITEPRWR